MNPNVFASYALLGELKSLGVSYCVISPGSRSTPLAYVAHEIFDTTVVIDERDAGFVALGIAETSDTPVVVITTSGSAPTHLYPSVVEAFHSRIPLIIISSDRPHEVRGRGAPQTIDQVELYGSAVQYSYDSEEPDEAQDDWYWIELASMLMVKLQGTENSRGPVHLNMGMKEPLVPDGDEREEYEKLLARIRPNENLTDENYGSWKFVPNKNANKLENFFDKEFLDTLSKAQKVALTVGRNANISGDQVVKLQQSGSWIVLADIVSGVRDCAGTISAYDAVIRRGDAESFIPEVVIQLGDPLTSKLWNQTIENSNVIAITELFNKRDPYGVITSKIEVPFYSETIDALCEIGTNVTAGYVDKWRKAQNDVIEQAKNLAVLNPDSEPALFLQIGAALESINNEISVLIASSMPIRFAEWFWNDPSENISFISHRGTNGIDGMLSSAYGIAHATSKPTICVLGDVAFSHDIGFLSRCSQLTDERNESVVFLVIDNDGGAIFRHLEQATNKSLESSYSEILQTSPNIDIEKISVACGANFFHGDSVLACKKLLEITENEISGTHVIHVNIEHESGPDFMAKLRNNLSIITE